MIKLAIYGAVSLLPTNGMTPLCKIKFSDRVCTLQDRYLKDRYLKQDRYLKYLTGMGSQVSRISCDVGLSKTEKSLQFFESFCSLLEAVLQS